MSQKKRSSSKVKKPKKKSKLEISAISPPVLRAIILFFALVVAVVAILHDAYDSKLWNFLTSVLMYAALTNGAVKA